jgi:hypothetical protein
MSVTEEEILDVESRANDVIPPDWRDLTTVSVPVGGAILGVSRNTSYTAVKSGDLPAIRPGRRLVVPVYGLRRLLGEVS